MLSQPLPGTLERQQVTLSQAYIDVLGGGPSKKKRMFGIGCLVHSFNTKTGGLSASYYEKILELQRELQEIKQEKEQLHNQLQTERDERQQHEEEVQRKFDELHTHRLEQQRYQEEVQQQFRAQQEMINQLLAQSRSSSTPS